MFGDTSIFEISDVQVHAGKDYGNIHSLFLVGSPEFAH